MTEDDARHFFYQIISAISYIHALHVAHRDIKLENILVTTGNRAKLSDFGLCKQTSGDTNMLTTCGTLLYAAPEILREVPYNGMKADIWSAGVVLYAMVANHFPWVTEEDLPPEKLMQETARQILEGDIEMPEGISYELQNMLSNMLDTNPDNRPTAKELLEHPWFEGQEGDSVNVSAEPDQDLVDQVESLIENLDARKADSLRRREKS
jgi:serine/threonine protein kinase